MSGLALPPEAFADLDQIHAHNAEDSPDAEERVVTEIFGALRQLVRSRQQGYCRPNLASRPIRFLVVRDYIIAHAPDPQPPWVLAVFNGRRNSRFMSAVLRGRE